MGFNSEVSYLPLLPQITKQQLQQTKDRFQAFLNGDTQIVADEAFINAVQSYYEVPTHLLTIAAQSQSTILLSRGLECVQISH